MKNLFRKMIDMMGKTGLSIFTVLVFSASVCAYLDGGIIPSSAIFTMMWAVVIIAAVTWTNKNKGF